MDHEATTPKGFLLDEILVSTSSWRWVANTTGCCFPVSVPRMMACAFCPSSQLWRKSQVGVAVPTPPRSGPPLIDHVLPSTAYVRVLCTVIMPLCIHNSALGQPFPSAPLGSLDHKALTAAPPPL